jgi:hypothetical protein
MINRLFTIKLDEIEPYTGFLIHLSLFTSGCTGGYSHLSLTGLYFNP